MARRPVSIVPVSVTRSGESPEGCANGGGAGAGAMRRAVDEGVEAMVGRPWTRRYRLSRRVGRRWDVAEENVRCAASTTQPEEEEEEERQQQRREGV